MNLVIYDCDKSYLKDMENTHFHDANLKYAFCQGCFDCWLRTPSKCKIKDKVYPLCDVMKDLDELIIITKSSFGSFSSQTKGVIDRLILFNLPFFKLINKELHHKPRYPKTIKIRVYVYNEVSDFEKECLITYVESIAKNFNCFDQKISFVSINEIGGVL